MDSNHHPKSLSRILLLLVLIGSCMILSGCPPTPSTDYEGIFLHDFSIDYKINFDTEAPPIVNISYFVNGMNKTAVFQLDGYNAEKNVGYQIVTVEDKNKWEQEYRNGIINAPDINDVALIQEAAANYEFPIFLICIYDYQNDSQYSKIADNHQKIRNGYWSVRKLDGIKQWSKKLLGDGEIIKTNLEMYCNSDYNADNIEFMHTDLTVKIEYGENKKAAFQLDGYDIENKIGYKFVTAEDKLGWQVRRLNGDIEAPDISEYEVIRESALKYNFPVIFIYMPEYWKYSSYELYRRYMKVPLYHIMDLIH